MSEQARRSGRAARVAARKSDVKQFHPAAPGQIGGRYAPLNAKELSDILETAYRILDEVGFTEVPPIVMEKALEQGCRTNALGRLSFPPQFR